MFVDDHHFSTLFCIDSALSVCIQLFFMSRSDLGKYNDDVVFKHKFLCHWCAHHLSASAKKHISMVFKDLVYTPPKQVAYKIIGHQGVVCVVDLCIRGKKDATHPSIDEVAAFVKNETAAGILTNPKYEMAMRTFDVEKDPFDDASGREKLQKVNDDFLLKSRFLCHWCSHHLNDDDKDLIGKIYAGLDDVDPTCFVGYIIYHVYTSLWGDIIRRIRSTGEVVVYPGLRAIMNFIINETWTSILKNRKYRHALISFHENEDPFREVTIKESVVK